MPCQFRKLTGSLLLFSTTFLFLAPQLVCADDHVVQSGELHRAIMDTARARLDHIATLERLFASGTARKALRQAKLNPEQIEKAVPFLENEELARLAARAEKIQNDFAAGALSNQEITYIIIALATAVLILVIVVA